MQKLKSKSHTENFLFYLLLTVVAIVMMSPGTMAEGISKGLELCATSIIPSLFPMMVLSDMLVSDDFPILLYKNRLSKAFGKLFGVSAIGIMAFVMGALCGFPIGAKLVSELYESGNISMNDAKRLMRFCNNTGPAFVVAGIGMKIYDNSSIGWILYISQILSAVLVGILFKILFNKKNGRNGTRDLTHNAEKYTGTSFVSSIARSAESMIRVCAFVLFFSFVCEYIFSVISSRMACAVISSFLEIGNASLRCRQIYAEFPEISVALASFAVSFSGTSVIMQSLSLLHGIRISFADVVIPKLLQGLISMFCTYLCVLIFTSF